MTDYKILCEQLADELSAIAPLAYNIASDDEDEVNAAYRLNAIIQSAYAALGYAPNT